MGHTHHAAHTSEVQPRNPAKVKHLLTVTLYLAVLTGVEFVLAFTMPRGHLLTLLFVLLTFVKTFYIVGEFMHLNYEVRMLKLAIIVLPIILISWLVLALLMEGHFVREAIVFIFGK
ncbi:cytochrome C oxidase subunit IV family protein [uncultured Cytophaga sp.]|uniref:cytochrome C oxidase subunit IV family protein n=1 Tax=uncultured Cytophaga sp. TaxID=160238 RepID=UPI00260F0322|nr:cytochrome C oxidase subunit IV family protein [uncultured Cytophaga sp.]